jgi:hypothetical protein
MKHHMRGRLCLTILAAIIGFGPLSTAARAQSLPLLAQIVSAGTTVPSSGTATVFTAPSHGNFILTQFCAGIAGMTLSGVGYIASIEDNPTGCVTFNPGFAVPQNQALECANVQAFPVGCSVTGYTVP